MILTSINIKNPSAEPWQAHIEKTFLENFEPNLDWYRFAEAPVNQKGSKSVVWLKMNKMEKTPSQARLQAGITPPPTGTGIGAVEVSAQQYGLYTVMSDEISYISRGMPLAEKLGNLIGDNMARIIDMIVQDEVMDNAQFRLYAATSSGGTRAANRNALTASHKLFALDIARAYTILREKNVPFRKDIGDRSYVGMLHPRVAESIKLESGTGTFLDIRKYAQPDVVLRGEIGKLWGVRLMEAPYNKIVVNTQPINVFQTVIFGDGAFGAAELDGIRVIIKGFESGGTEDALEQRSTVGSKVYMAAKILQQDAIIVIESAGNF